MRLGLVLEQFTQSPDGLLHSNAVTATGILIKRGTVTPPATVVLTSTSLSVAGAPAILTAAAPHLLGPGDEITITGATTATPTTNGSWIVASVPSPTTFTLQSATGVPYVTTLAGTGGTIQQTYAAVAEVKEVVPGGATRNPIVTTTHNDGASSKVYGILQHSDPSMKVNFIGSNSTHVAIWADLTANIKNLWKIVYPSGVARAGLAYVAGFVYDPVPVDAEQSATITLGWAGSVTETLM
jgi:hypothetical protein